jgi:SAM-dependent methyltransferase
MRQRRLCTVPRTGPFEAYHQRYEAWFDRHEPAYISELLALRPFVPRKGHGIEIGVGGGRFAGPLGVQVGLDPSRAMLAYAVTRGIEVVQGAAEALPFADASFDHALVVTTICFVDSPEDMLSEAHRVVRPGGRLVIGFIDRDSTLGQDYLAHQFENVFYREATFYSAGEVAGLLEAGGFAIEDWAQTLALPLAETRSIEPLRAGHGQCAFAVVAAVRQGVSDFGDQPSGREHSPDQKR